MEQIQRDFSEQCGEELCYTPINRQIKWFLKYIRLDLLILAEEQRMYVWGLVQRMNIIDSIMIGIPIPEIHLWKITDSNRLYISDGQQRLISIWSFYNNLFHWEKKSTGEKVFYNEIPKKYKNDTNTRIMNPLEKNKFENFNLQTKELEPASKKIRALYFERINCGTKFKQADWIGTSIDSYFFQVVIPNIFKNIPTFFSTFQIGNFSSIYEFYTDEEISLKYYKDRDDEGREGLTSLLPYVVAGFGIGSDEVDDELIPYKYATTSASKIKQDKNKYFDKEIDEESIQKNERKMKLLENIFKNSQIVHNTTSNLIKYVHLPCVVLYDINKNYTTWNDEKTHFWINVINHYLISGDYISTIEFDDEKNKSMERTKREPKLINKFREKILKVHTYPDNNVTSLEVQYNSTTSINTEETDTGFVYQESYFTEPY